MHRNIKNKGGRLQISLSPSFSPTDYRLIPFPFANVPIKTMKLYLYDSICNKYKLKALAVSCKSRNSSRGWLMAVPLAVMFDGNAPVSNSSSYSRMQQLGHCDFLSGLLCHLSSDLSCLERTAYLEIVLRKLIVSY